MSGEKFYPFCSVTELKKELRVTKWMDELRDEISAFYIDGEILVMSTVCPHFGGEYSYDKKGTLTCRWHGWKFDVRTGKSLTQLEAYHRNSLIRRVLEGKGIPLGCFPFKGELPRYNFRVQQDTVEVAST